MEHQSSSVVENGTTERRLNISESVAGSDESGDEFEFEVHEKSVTLVRNSCNLFPPSSGLRQLCLWLVEWKYWECVILVLALVSTCSLGAYDYSDRKNETTANKALDVVVYVLTVFFFLEATIKIIAFGLAYHSTGYFRKAWNVFDFIVLIILFTYCVPGLYVPRGLRVLLVLRVLKIAYALTSMKNLLEPFMYALSQLPRVIIFLLFILFIFALVGLDQLQGDLYYRCRTTPEPVEGTWELDGSLQRPCSAEGYGDYQCPAERFCGHPDVFGLSLEKEDMVDSGTFLYGAANFDDIFKALVASFQIITFDSWADHMYKYQDATNTYFARIFFPLLVFVGGFFSLNLIVAVIVDSFIAAKESAGKTAPAEASSVIVPKNDESEIPNNSKVVSPMRGYSYKSWGDIRLPKPKAEPESDGDKRVEKFRAFVKGMTDHIGFKLTIIVLVLGNLVVLAIDRYDIEESEADLLDILDVVFWGLFCLEMSVKLFASGMRKYLGERYNVLDCVINVCGIVDIALTYSSVGDGYHARVVIAILRTTRAFKLINKWEPLGALLTFIWKSISDITNFAVLLAIFIFMFAVIGMELFADAVKFDANNMKDLVHGVSDRIHYDDIGNALRSVFALLVGDNWTTTFYLYSRFNMTSAVIFFISATFVINILMLNLFLAIILQNFFDDEQKKRLDEEERENQEFLDSKKSKKGGVIIKKSTGTSDGIAGNRGLEERYRHRERTLLTALKVFKSVISLGKEIEAKRQKTYLKDLVGVTLMLFGAESKVRKQLHKILESSQYQFCLYIIMFTYSIMLSFHTPIYDPHSAIGIAVEVIDIVTAVLFGLDATCKIVTFGLAANGAKSYLRSGWNIMDLALTVIQIVNLALPSWLVLLKKLLYMCSVMRIVKIVTASEGFKLCIQAIMNGFLRIVQTIFIAMLFFFMFAVVGVKLFGGYLYYCDRANLGSADIVTIYDCFNYGGEWRDRDVSFNNIFSAILTLFELFTGKSLTTLYRYLPDVSDLDLEPVKDSQPFYSLFIVFFMIIGFIFTKAIVTGVISDTFFKEKDILQGFNNLTPAQLKWAKLANIMFKAHPVQTYSRESRFYPLHSFLTHPAYNWFIIAILVLNGVSLSFTWHRVDSKIDTVHDIFTYVFLAIYTAEIAVKLLCYGKCYFCDGWNKFDFAVVLGAILCLIIGTFSNLSSKPYEAITTVFLVSKLLSLFKLAGVLRKMFQTFILALAPIVNLALLFFIFIYLFDIAGVLLFAETKLQTYLEVHANFQNFWYGFLTVFRLSTFDGWNDIMHDVMRQRTQYFDCADYPTYDDIRNNGGDPNGCGLAYAPIFCVLLELIVTFVFLNLFVAIVVGSMMDITKLSESVLSDDKLLKFQHTWKQFDPDADGYIEYSTFRAFLSKLGKPLGAHESKMASRYYSAITMWMLDLKIYHRPANNLNYLEFYDVLEALVKRTIYRARTLDDIYNNPSHEKLREGLSSMWDQKTQLSFENQPALQKVENLRRYYDKKKEKTNTETYQKIKIMLPQLVWNTLRISRTLKKQVKARKKAGKLCLKTHDAGIIADSNMPTPNNVSYDRNVVVVTPSRMKPKEEEDKLQKHDAHDSPHLEEFEDNNETVRKLADKSSEGRKEIRENNAQEPNDVVGASTFSKQVSGKSGKHLQVI